MILLFHILNEVKQLNWNIFWEAAGAIATFSAVVVALWQTKYVNNKKAKLHFTDNVSFAPVFLNGDVGDVLNTKYVGINFINVGNRKIIIKSFWVELPDNCCAIIQPDAIPTRIVSLPVELDIEESVFLPWAKEKFLKFISNENPLNSKQKLVFGVTDSTGVTYKCKTPKTVSEYLKLIEERN